MTQSWHRFDACRAAIQPHTFGLAVAPISKCRYNAHHSKRKQWHINTSRVSLWDTHGIRSRCSPRLEVNEHLEPPSAGWTVSLHFWKSTRPPGLVRCRAEAEGRAWIGNAAWQYYIWNWFAIWFKEIADFHCTCTTKKWLQLRTAECSSTPFQKACRYSLIT